MLIRAIPHFERPLHICFKVQSVHTGHGSGEELPLQRAVKENFSGFGAARHGTESIR